MAGLPFQMETGSQGIKLALFSKPPGFLDSQGKESWFREDCGVVFQAFQIYSSMGQLSRNWGNRVTLSSEQKRLYHTGPTSEKRKQGIYSLKEGLVLTSGALECRPCSNPWARWERKCLRTLGAALVDGFNTGETSVALGTNLQGEGTFWQTLRKE